MNKKFKNDNHEALKKVFETTLQKTILIKFNNIIRNGVFKNSPFLLFVFIHICIQKFENLKFIKIIFSYLYTF